MKVPTRSPSHWAVYVDALEVNLLPCSWVRTLPATDSVFYNFLRSIVRFTVASSYLIGQSLSFHIRIEVAWAFSHFFSTHSIVSFVSIWDSYGETSSTPVAKVWPHSYTLFVDVFMGFIEGSVGESTCCTEVLREFSRASTVLLLSLPLLCFEFISYPYTVHR